MGHMVTVCSKGQLVIPAALRRKLRIKSGTRIAVEERDGQITLIPNPYDALLALRGKFAQYPLEEDLVEERRKWDERLESM
jgi:AbrB family looped-hinge helix DNA binding protein